MGMFNEVITTTNNGGEWTYAAPSGHQRSITLASGGSLTILGHFNLMTLSDEDRALVLGIADTFNEYERKHRAQEEAPTK